MKWFAISGSWRKINKEMDEKIRSVVREIIIQGDGIVSGGALGVDFVALDEVLKYDLKAEKIKIFLPTILNIYTKHYRKHASLGTITGEQAESLINQLVKLKNINPKALIENFDANFTEETKKQMYYKRNSDIIDISDELIAFRVKTDQSEGMGTADAIEKAKKKGLHVKIYSYDFTN